MQKNINAALLGMCWETLRDGPAITRTVLAFVVMGVIAIGCSSDDSEELLAVVERGEFGLQSLVTSASDIMLSVGQTTALTARAEFRGGESKSLDGTVWESLDPSVASVDAAGAITAVGEGSTTISVTLRDESAQATVTVTEATLEAISLTPDSLEIAECGAAMILAHTVYSDGTEHDLPTSALLRVVDEAIVSAQRLPAIEEGAQDESGDESGTGNQSASDASADAQIQIVAHDAGSTQLTVTVGDISSVVPVVALDTLTGIDIGSEVLRLVPGELISVSATGSYSDSSIADISSAGSWSLIAEDGTDLSINVSVLDTPDDKENTDTAPDESESGEPFAVLSSNGDGSFTVRTREAGSAVLRFDCGGLSQTVQVIIDLPPVLQAISIDNSDAFELVAGGAATILASAIFADGTTGEFEEEVEWALSDETAGFEITSDGSGVVSVEVNENTLLETSVDLSATVGDIVGSVTLTANAGVTDSLQAIRMSYEDSAGDIVAITAGRIHQAEVGDVIQFHLTVEFQGGRLATPERVTWGNATPAIATVDQNGVVTAHSIGSTFISAFTEAGQIHLPLMVSEVGSGIEEAARATSWSDSYAVDGQCYCDSNYDHGLTSVIVDTPDGLKSVPQICADINALLGNGSNSQRIYYNTIQCGHGPANSAADESTCPGIPAGVRDYTGARCYENGPTWNLEEIYSQ